MEYKGSDIKKIIEELKLNNWTFSYIGTDHDVEKFAVALSINNAMSFDKDEAGIKSMFLKERNARRSYYQKINLKENTVEDFYEGDDKKIRV